MEKNEIIEKQRKALAREGLDALVAVSPENVGYTAGFMIPSQRIPIRKRHFFSVVTADGQATLVVVQVEFNEAKANSHISDVRAYNEFKQGPAEVLAECLREFGLAKGKIGLEIDFLPARTFIAIQKELPDVHFVDAEPIFDHLRMVKTTDEIERLRRCGQIVNQAHKEIQAEAHAGMSEMDVAISFIEKVLKKGVDYLDKIVIGSGERSTFANCPPTQRVLRNGDVMRIDVFANIGGYLSDIARTMVVGKATTEQKVIWSKLVESQSLLESIIRPGAKTEMIWNRFLEHFHSMGLEPEINFLGHGLGLTLHEEPFISRYHNHTIEENMVLSIEPVYFQPNMGFHLEDEIIVRSDGCELISDGRGPLPELGI